MRLYQLIILIFLMNLNFLSFSQDNLFLSDNYYLHIDRKYYLSGEEIQFKAYSPYGKSNKPEFLSKVLYLSLVNSEGKSVANQKFQIKENHAYGHVLIPDNIPSGCYTLFAYTKWQRNFSNDSYSKRKITIINSETGINYKVSQINSNKPEFHLFAEGGKFRSGVQNKIVFYSMNSFGEIVHSKGCVVDENENLITEFESSANGIGDFELVLDKSKKYNIQVEIDSFKIKKSIQNISESNCTFFIDNSKNNYLEIGRNNKQPNNLNESYLIEIEHNGIVYKAFQDSGHQEKFVLRIPKRQLIPGLNRIFFLDSRTNEIAYEQLILIKNNEAMDLTLQLNKNQYKRREKVDVELKALVYQMPQFNTDLSVSVTKLEGVFNISDYQSFSLIESNVFSNTEFINDFNPVEMSSTVFHKDFANYLTTKLSTKTSKKVIKFLPENKGAYLSGEVLDQNGKIINKKAILFVTSLGADRKTEVITTDNYGQFVLPINLLGSSEAIFQMFGPFSNYSVRLNEEFESNFPGEKKSIPLLRDKTKNFVKRLMLNYQINSQFNNINSDSTNIGRNIKLSRLFYGQPDSSYILNNYIDLPTMEEVFNNLIYNVQAKKKQHEVSFSVYDNNERVLTFPPLLLIDGIPVSGSKILGVHPSKIKKIELINSNYVINDVVFGGIISLFSNNGDLAGMKLSDNSQVKGFGGYDDMNEQSYPDKLLLKDKNIPDLRNTIYWNPKLTTNKNGKAHFSFYTSDETGKFLIQVEGISEEGIPGKGYYIYEVVQQNLLNNLFLKHEF